MEARVRQQQQLEEAQGAPGVTHPCRHTNTAWFVLHLPGYPPTWDRELGHGGYPPVARPWLPCLSPTPAQRAGPQSQQGPCCRADGEVSVPSGKTERVFLAVTQALEEAAALLPPASASEEEGMGVSASVAFSQGLYPALAEGASSALPGVTSA